MSLVQIHTLRACSLLVLHPPPDRMPMQGGFPMDLSELNLLGWATLVQDIVAGLQALPPNLGHDMGLPAVALLQLLETSTGLGFCHYCCHLGSRCTCMGAYQPAPPQSWSQIVEQTPGYGVTASSAGMTTPSTTVAGMSGYVAPIWGTTCSRARPISCGEIHTSQGHGREAGSGTASTMSKGSGPTCSDTAPGSTVHPSGGATSPPTTTWVAGNMVPAGSTAAKEVHWEGSHFRPLHR